MRAKRETKVTSGHVAPFPGLAGAREAGYLNYLVHALHRYRAMSGVPACLLFDRLGMNQYHFSPN